MSLSAELLAIKEAIGQWIGREGGVCEIAGDPVHLFALLGAAPGGLRAALWPVSEETVSEPAGGRAVRKFWIVLSRGRGFALAPSDSLVGQTAGERALFDLVEEARDVARGLAIAGEMVEFISWQPFQLAGERIVDAYQLQFSYGTQLPSV